MTSKTNKFRANRGRKLLKYHQRNLMEETPDALPDSYNVAAMITDIRHLCHQSNADFFHALSISLEDFIEELNSCDDYLDNTNDQETHVCPKPKFRSTNRLQAVQTT